ncbi:hypothetical protein [Streptomyces chiangmaiensis]|uniref:Uncharacterized protein n=1 Tax=Streptomyces chiangmaiensis TaxID=766497 RepID=A0ABU7FI81_9ACTN|nr:hypothetical protein [Streptomyces chiangmaiensis]MED7823842.1 hypothetical protein [Streptomyces chiangmaiensis]
MGCDEVLRQLEERESAFRVEVERLQDEYERLGVLLADRRGELDRVRTARQVIDELPATHPAPGPVPSVADVLPAPRGEAAASAVGGMTAEAVLAVLSERGPQRCRDVVGALGGDGMAAREIERVRHRLKRLKDQGLVAEPARGVFTLAGTKAAAKG